MLTYLHFNDLNQEEASVKSFYSDKYAKKALVNEIKSTHESISWFMQAMLLC
jgi:hypothetical protein